MSEDNVDDIAREIDPAEQATAEAVQATQPADEAHPDAVGVDAADAVASDPTPAASVPAEAGQDAVASHPVAATSAPADAEPADRTGADEDAEQTPTFADLGLNERILKALKGLGYETPSPIQAETIPALLAGCDVVGLAQTGTGKTAAFALPILNRIDLKQKTPQALILAPTRELAVQVCEAFEKYSAHLKDVRVLPVYGGQGYGVQLSALARGVHVVVGTPGRIMDHLDRGTLDLSELRYLVLDEADEMLSMGFSEDIEHILSGTPDDKQVALFSATMPKQIRSLSQAYLNDPVEILVKGKTATAANVTHRYLIVSYPQKVDALTRILEVENFEGLIVFVRTKNETETLAEKLRARGFSAAAINGDMPQAARERTINQLKNAKLDILVATDVAARGLDVDRISHVVNYDIPTDTESYVHRIGRTGRAGRSGAAISFVTPRERHLLRAIERATGQELAAMKVPTADDINATRLTRFDEAITAALADPETIAQFRDIVGHYINEYAADELDVAAALAAVLQGDEPMLLEPEPERPVRAFDDKGRDRRDRDDRGERGGRFERDDRGTRGRRDSSGFASYRISVGRRHKVTPRMIVGALANEGGLGRDDFGRIDIRGDFSIVELPPQLPAGAEERLAETRISGQLIELQPDRGRGGQRRDDRGFQGRRDDRRGGYRGGDRERGFQRDDRGGRGYDRDDRGYQRRDDRGGRGYERDERGSQRRGDRGGRGRWER